MLNFDVIIIGGGIAGLWTLNRLRKQGYQAILLEKNSLGSGQTIASQGIIHGGIKYSLQGALSRSSLEISEMPARWQACLQQHGELDLSPVHTLSAHYYLCAQQALTQNISQFFAQKILRSHSTALEKNTYPAFFGAQFTGRLTQVDELVLDIPTLLHTLTQPMLPFIFKVDELILQPPCSVQIQGFQQAALQLSGKKIILTAGAGNAQLLAGITQEPLMQRRPLHMVSLTAEDLPPLFVHCIGLNTDPLLTITSHLNRQGKIIWYLGGQLAEAGVHRDPDQQIHAAATLIAQQFPWFTPRQAQWETLRIDRAEGFNQGARPDSVRLHALGDFIAAWPTKLTFAPLLAEKLAQHLPPPSSTPMHAPALMTWPKPQIAPTIW